GGARYLFVDACDPRAASSSPTRGSSDRGREPAGTGGEHGDPPDEFGPIGCEHPGHVVPECVAGHHGRCGVEMLDDGGDVTREVVDRKSTRLNSSHVKTSYAVFCSKKKTR